MSPQENETKPFLPNYFNNVMMHEAEGERGQRLLGDTIMKQNFNQVLIPDLWFPFCCGEKETPALWSPSCRF